MPLNQRVPRIAAVSALGCIGVGLVEGVIFAQLLINCLPYKESGPIYRPLGVVLLVLSVGVAGGVAATLRNRLGSNAPILAAFLVCVAAVAVFTAANFALMPPPEARGTLEFSRSGAQSDFLAQSYRVLACGLVAGVLAKVAIALIGLRRHAA